MNKLELKANAEQMNTFDFLFKELLSYLREGGYHWMNNTYANRMRLYSVTIYNNQPDEDGSANQTIVYNNQLGWGWNSGTALQQYGSGQAHCTKMSIKKNPQQRGGVTTEEMDRTLDEDKHAYRDNKRRSLNPCFNRNERIAYGLSAHPSMPKKLTTQCSQKMDTDGTVEPFLGRNDLVNYIDA